MSKFPYFCDLLMFLQSLHAHLLRDEMYLNGANVSLCYRSQKAAIHGHVEESEESDQSWDFPKTSPTDSPQTSGWGQCRLDPPLFLCEAVADPNILILVRLYRSGHFSVSCLVNHDFTGIKTVLKISGIPSILFCADMIWAFLLYSTWTKNNWSFQYS